MTKVSIIIPVYNQQELILKALESIPNREDIEIIVVDDGSTDNSYDVALNWMLKKKRVNGMIITEKREHKGVAYTVNQGYDNAHGEYVVLLGSDDYFCTGEFEKCMEELDGTDLVYFNARINNGDVWDLNSKSADWMCGSYRFTKRSLIGKDRCEDWEYGEDRSLWNKIKVKPHTTKYTHLVVKHYNHPREGSITDLHDKGKDKTW